jgi:hypothetical protein
MRFLRLPLALAALLMTLAPAQADRVADFYRGKTVNVLIGGGGGGEYDLQAAQPQPSRINDFVN